MEELWCVNSSAPMLPFQLKDASRRVKNQEEEEETYVAKEVSKEEAKVAAKGEKGGEKEE